MTLYFLYRIIILCYTHLRRHFLSVRKDAPHIHREMCGSIFFFYYHFAFLH